MERFRNAFNMARNLPDAQAEPALRDLLREYPALPAADEGGLRYALGLALFHQNRAEEAREEFSRACALLEQAPGPDLALAETALARAALAIRRKVLGDHPETAFSMGNLGTALAAAGHWQEAADMLEEAIACYARCGRTEGRDIDGYRYNLNICKKALS